MRQWSVRPATPLALARFLSWRVILPLSFLAGCETHHDGIIESRTIGDPFEVSAAGYCTTYFFVDTSCARLYEPYFLSDPPMVDGGGQILAIEVWVSRLGSVPNVLERQAWAYLHLGPRGGGYADSLRLGIVQGGLVEAGPFVKLEKDQFDLLGEGYPGIIRLNVPVSDFAAVAVAYRRGDMAQFGEFIRDAADSSFWSGAKPMVLRLVKPRNLITCGPLYRDAWKLLVKSIYPTGFAGLAGSAFHLEVLENTDPAGGERSIQGHDLLAVLGLDRYSSGGMPGADGVFDYRPGRTIDPLRGDIILPYLRPFDEGIRKYFASIGERIAEGSTVFLPQLYDTTAASLARRLGSKYVFRGSALHH